MATTLPLKQAALNTMYNQPAHVSLAVAAMHCIAANQLPLAAQLCRQAINLAPATAEAYGPQGPRTCLQAALTELGNGDGEDAVDWLLDVA
jgi:hypothetical protein